MKQSHLSENMYVLFHSGGQHDFQVSLQASVKPYFQALHKQCCFKEMSQEWLRMQHDCTGSPLVEVPLAVG